MPALPGRTGYIRHLEWHRQAKDTWTWYGWTIWAGERQRWFVYATFGHSAAALDNPVSPADDEKDNIVNVTPHGHFVGSALYEYLPALSRGTGQPEPTVRLELTTVDLVLGWEKAFEAAISADQSRLQGETLWYRMVAGGATPRYLRLRPRPNLSALLEGMSEQALPEKVNGRAITSEVMGGRMSARGTRALHPAKTAVLKYHRFMNDRETVAVGSSPNRRAQGRRRSLTASREAIAAEEVADAFNATPAERIEAMIALLDAAFALWAARGLDHDEGLCRFPGITQQRRRGLCRDRGDRGIGPHPVPDHP